MNRKDQQALKNLSCDKTATECIIKYSQELKNHSSCNSYIKSTLLLYAIREQYELKLIQYLIDYGVDLTFHNYEVLILVCTTYKLRTELYTLIINQFQHIPTPILIHMLSHPDISINVIDKLITKCSDTVALAKETNYIINNYKGDILCYLILHITLDSTVLDTICIEASKHNDLTTLKYALDYGAKITVFNECKCITASILIYIVSHPDITVDIIDKLVGKCSDIIDLAEEQDYIINNYKGDIICYIMSCVMLDKIVLNTICAEAMKHNDLVTLKCAIQYGASVPDLNKELISWCVDSIIHYLIELKVYDIKVLDAICDKAIKYNNVKMLKHAVNYSATLPKLNSYSIFMFPESIVHYLIESHAPNTLDTLCVDAIRTNDLQTLKLTIRYGVNIKAFMIGANDNELPTDAPCINLRIIRYLISCGICDQNQLYDMCSWAIHNNDHETLICSVKSGVILTVDDIQQCKNIKIFRHIILCNETPGVTKDFLKHLHLRAIKENDYKMMKCAVSRLQLSDIELPNPTQHTNIKIMRYNIQTRCYNANQLCEAICIAIKRNDLKTLKWAIMYGAKPNYDTCLELAIDTQCQDAGIIYYLIEQGASICSVSNKLLLYAVNYGMLDLIMFCLDNGTSDVYAGIVLAVDKQYIDCIPYLVGKSFDISVFENIIRNANYETFLNVVHYIPDIHYNCDEALRIAAQSGQLSIVRQLVTVHGLKWYYKSDRGFNTLTMAISEGHLDVIKYLLESGGAYLGFENVGHDAIKLAIARSDIDMIQYLISKKVTLNTEMEQAVNDILTTSRKHECTTTFRSKSYRMDLTY